MRKEFVKTRAHLAPKRLPWAIVAGIRQHGAVLLKSNDFIAKKPDKKS